MRVIDRDDSTICSVKGSSSEDVTHTLDLAPSERIVAASVSTREDLAIQVTFLLYSPPELYGEIPLHKIEILNSSISNQYDGAPEFYSTPRRSHMLI